MIADMVRDQIGEALKAAADRAERLKLVAGVGDLEDEDILYTEPEDLRRYLLVEQSTVDGALWLTAVDSPADAADYHLTQECPEYWNVVCLVDLDDGTVHAPSVVFA